MDGFAGSIYLGYIFFAWQWGSKKGFLALEIIRKSPELSIAVRLRFGANGATLAAISSKTI